MTRRSHGDGGLYWREDRQRWVAEVTIGYDARGKRRTRKSFWKTKTEANLALKKAVREIDSGRVGDTKITVEQVVNDWLDHGLTRPGEATVKKYKIICRVHVIPGLGRRKLKDLSANDVETWLDGLTSILGTDMLRRAHWCLSKAVRRAMARELVHRNVVELVDVPTGRDGRPSKSLTPEQVDDVLEKTVPDRMYGYIVLSLLTGARTEELRALRWDHVYLEPEPIKGEPVPPHIAVWRSVRRRGETKTPKSRRTLALPAMCIEALKRERALQAAERLKAGETWTDSGLVFTTRVGTKLDAANVRRGFRRALKLVPDIDPEEWIPRELRHSFVSLLSHHGLRIEEISMLVGHRGTTVTELVYHHQLRPVIQTGALAMDEHYKIDEESG